MSVSGQKFDLPQMKAYFEEQIPHVRLLSDLTLSQTDFKSLGAKLKSAFAFTDKKDGIEDIMLCYLVYWVHALIYWDEETGIHDELTDYCEELPQHQLRHHFEMLVDAFADYNIEKFGYKDDNIEELASILIARHAGIPNDGKGITSPYHAIKTTLFPHCHFCIVVSLHIYKLAPLLLETPKHGKVYLAIDFFRHYRGKIYPINIIQGHKPLGSSFLPYPLIIWGKDCHFPF